MVYQIDAEKLAYWYFRLNGCLTIQNFVIHPDAGYLQRTDVDLIAVRFPYRAELQHDTMQDDIDIFPDPAKIRLIIAEVTKGRCKLNVSWMKPEKETIQAILRAIGAFPINMVDTISQRLHNKGSYQDSQFHISLCCLGSHESPYIGIEYPEAKQLVWDYILRFIYDRYAKYPKQKSSHPQWDDVGKKLWKLAESHCCFDDFRQSVMVCSKQHSQSKQHK